MGASLQETRELAAGRKVRVNDQGAGSRTLGTQTRNPLGITRICDRDCGVSRGFDSSGSLRFIPSVTIQIRVV